MKVFVVKDYDALSRKTAEIVVDLIRRKPDTIFCLPAGGSPIGMYKVLVDMYQQHEVDFSRLITFDMAEYVGVGPRDENSYAYFMQKHFLKYVNVDPKNVHYPDGLAEDIDEMCRLYSEQIFAMGGLDIAITGIGDDGDALYPRTHAVDLAESTRRANARFFDGDITRVPKRACSIGMEDIMRTKTFLVVASGKHKAELIRKTFCEEMIDPQWPVSFCRMHPNCIFIIDEDAASACDPNVWKPYQ